MPVSLPEPLTRLWKQTGAILSIGNAVLALIIGVLAYGFIGVVALVAAGAVLVAAELSRYSVGLESDRDAANDRCDALASEVTRFESKKDEESETRAHLEKQLSGAIERLTSGDFTLERLQAAQASVGEAAGEVWRHRKLSEGTALRWPVIEMSMTDEGYVKVTCDLQGRSEEGLDDEAMMLMVPGDLSAVEVQHITCNAGMLSCRCLIDKLPLDVAADLNAYRKANPEGYDIALRGLYLPAYKELSTDSVRKLYEVMSAAVPVVSELLRETHQIANMENSLWTQAE